MNTIQQQFEAQDAWGISTSVDLYDCNPDTIRSADKIQQFAVELCDLIKVKRFGECTVVHFGEDEKVNGYSMTQLIETSLVSGHFANQTNAAYIDVFSCRLYGPEVVARFARAFFEAESIKMHYTLRK